jgi:hypothetical protein
MEDRPRSSITRTWDLGKLTDDLSIAAIALAKAIW